MMAPSQDFPSASQRALPLVQRPVLLVLVLLAVNALTRPYANITHDARLYSAQVLNQVENGSYNNDLFFRYGSQDSYSLFSLLLAPLVKVFGLKTAFFLVYLAGNILFITALVRLIPRLVEDRWLALLALFYLVIAPLNYGGRNMLHVHEPFLTPRLLAVGLILFGFDQLLLRRSLPALLLLVAAGLLHPLMAAGGFLIWGGMVLVDWLGWRKACLVGSGLALAGAAVLAVPSVAGRLLVTMDDPWREALWKACPFCFLSEWEPGDWINVFVCVIGLAAGIVLSARYDSRRAQFYFIVLLLGVAAVLGNVVADHLPYALLVQGQPFRALWILKVLQAPLCFVLADRLWRSGTIASQVLALSLFAYFTMFFLAVEWILLLLFLPLVMVCRRFWQREPCQSDWVAASVAGAMLMVQFVSALFNEVQCLQHRQELLILKDPVEFIQFMILIFGTVPWMLLVLGVGYWVIRSGAEARTLGLACLGLFLAVNLFFFILPQTSLIRESENTDLADTLFVRDVLAGHQQAGRRNTVFSDNQRVELIWFELQANCYFDWWQTGGFTFQRQTAMEGERRARLAGPFVVQHYRPFGRFLNSRVKSIISRFFLRELEDPAPTVEDLALLCEDSELDYAILKQEFPGLYAASNGRVFLYDCRQVHRAKE